jgi:hypothetical protein
MNSFWMGKGPTSLFCNIQMDATITVIMIIITAIIPMSILLVTTFKKNEDFIPTCNNNKKLLQHQIS